MTFEEIIDMSVAEQEAMTDAQLTQHFEKYFKVTRPQMNKTLTPQGELKLNNNQSTQRQPSKQSYQQEQRKKAIEMAKKFGIDLGTL